MQEIELFSAKNGVSGTHGPCQIACQKVLDCKHDCECQFGSFVQGCDAKTPHATAAERAVDGINLGTTEDNAQGGHESLNLNAKRCYTQGQVTLMPAPDRTIKKAEALAAADGVQSLERITRLIA